MKYLSLSSIYLKMQGLSVCVSVSSTHNPPTTYLTDLKFGGCHPNRTSVCCAMFYWSNELQLPFVTLLLWVP